MQVEQKATFAAFTNEEFGITGGLPQEANTVYITSDEGQSWIRSETFTGFLFSEDIVDVQSIWQCGRITFSTSKDGGQTWEHDIVPVGLGVLYLSHDGEYLTVTEVGGGGKVILLEYQSNVESGN